MLNWLNKELAVLLQKTALRLKGFPKYFRLLFFEFLKSHAAYISNSRADTLRLLPIRIK